MARIRTIKPEFWSDEKLSECSLSARLTFIGLWSFADDQGRLEYQPSRLRMQIYPCGSVSVQALTEMLGVLTEHSLIRRYEVDGKSFIDIPGFEKHQRINRPTPSKLPEYSLSPHGVLREHSSLELEGKGTGTGSGAHALSTVSGAGRTGESTRGVAARPKVLGSSRVPADFLPDLEYARAHLPGVDAEAEAQKFRDWEFKTPRKDWAACWRTWVANCRERGQYAKPSTARRDASGLEVLRLG